METMEPMEVSENPTENASGPSGASWLEAPRGFFFGDNDMGAATPISVALR